jgi:uracil-DNA glycosylase
MINLVNEIVAHAAANVFNPWSDSDPMDATILEPVRRRQRLVAHFDCSPSFLLVGEAPGYKGCHFSGVPFTSERQLLDGGVPRIECEGRITTRKRPWTEASATIVWETLHEPELHDRVVMWNAFPWHPHEPGDRHSNRTPTQTELEAGAPILKAVIDHFVGVPVIAVGRQAAAALRKLGVTDHTPVRHPARAGAQLFRAGMKELGRLRNGNRR